MKPLTETSEAYRILLECIDAALIKLGTSVRESVYYYVKINFGLEKSNIPYNLQLFEEALTSLFGEQGAKVIKKMVLIEIKDCFKLKKQPSLNFKELVPFIQSLNVKIMKDNLENI